MKKKYFGKTGKRVSILGFGGMRFKPQDDEQNAVRTLLRAVERGINYFDTAPGYCDDHSETFFGAGLSQVPKEQRGEIYISTKSSIQSDATADAVRRRIDEQLKKLRCEKITFYTMWCLMDLDHFNRVMAPGGPYEGAYKAKQEGLVEHITCSTHARGDEIQEIAKSGAFEAITLSYNLLNQSLRRQCLNSIAEQNMGLVVMNPLGGGMLSQSPTAEQRLSFLRTREDDSVIAASLRFLFAHPEISVVLSGMGSPQEVDFNASVADSAAEPDPEIVERIISTYEQLGERYCTGCRYCLEHCPENIKIHLYMNIWDRVRVDMADRAKRMHDFYVKQGWLGDARAADCTQCGECEIHCTQQLPIRQYLEDIVSYFD